MTRAFDKYCQEMAMEDLESEVPQEVRERWPMQDYYKEHKACPVCGSTRHGSTYVGFVTPPDTNKVWCACGWEGITDDLKPENWKHRMNTRYPVGGEE